MRRKKGGGGGGREREGRKTGFCSGISLPGNPVKVRFEKSEPNTSDLEKNKLPEGWEKRAFCTLLF